MFSIILNLTNTNVIFASAASALPCPKPLPDNRQVAEPDGAGLCLSAPPVATMPALPTLTRQGLNHQKPRATDFPVCAVDKPQPETVPPAPVRAAMCA